MIQIRLCPVGGTETTYKSRGVRMRSCLEAYRLYEKYEACRGDYGEDLIEECLEFICGCFDHAFTVDALLDGYAGTPYALIPQMLREVIGYVNDRIVIFPTAAAQIQTDAQTEAD